MPFDEQYFSSHTYEHVSFARFSQYWWSNRFYAILARRHARRGGRLLEIGSGLGHLVGQLEGRFKTFAADVNPWALERSRQVAGGSSHLASSAEELPFASGTFDAVILKHVVEHLAHPEQALTEVGRVTAAGGILILATPNLASLLKPWKGERWIGYQDPTHISLRPPQEWLAAVRQVGFEPVRLFSDGFWDVPYVRSVPPVLQKLFFGLPGGIQAVTGIPFLPLQWGESLILIARRGNRALSFTR
jgi:2-polyprenyl-3-methyl-5-hydroxy-6-metoxy-1,4-benzoquinol methylase